MKAGPRPDVTSMELHTQSLREKESSASLLGVGCEGILEHRDNKNCHLRNPSGFVWMGIIIADPVAKTVDVINRGI